MLLFLLSYIESTSIVGVIDPPNIAGHQNIHDIPLKFQFNIPHTSVLNVIGRGLGGKDIRGDIHKEITKYMQLSMDYCAKILHFGMKLFLSKI